jgi:hypothetical protein
MCGVRKNLEGRLRQALTRYRNVIGWGNNHVFLRPCHSDGTWERVERCNLLVVRGEDFAGDGASEEVVENLDAYPIPVTRANLESEPTDRRRLQRKASVSHGVNHFTASGVGCTPSLRMRMPSTLLV